MKKLIAITAVMAFFTLSFLTTTEAQSMSVSETLINMTATHMHYRSTVTVWAVPNNSHVLIDVNGVQVGDLVMNSGQTQTKDYYIERCESPPQTPVTYTQTDSGLIQISLPVTCIVTVANCVDPGIDRPLIP